MKAVFTCDDVFEILTREPFPSGDSGDDIVESHLAVCHECRQLAEAFRPAVGLFHESLAAESDQELPSYRGRLLPMIEALPEPTAELVESPPSMTDRSQMLFSMTIVASLFLVGSIVFAAMAANYVGNNEVAVIAPIDRDAGRDYTLLAALEIPRDCRSLAESSNAATHGDFVCCTKCHNTTSRVASTEVAILKSSAACVACHDRLVDEALSWNPPSRQPLILGLALANIRNL